MLAEKNYHPSLGKKVRLLRSLLPVVFCTLLFFVPSAMSRQEKDLRILLPDTFQPIRDKNNQVVYLSYEDIERLFLKECHGVEFFHHSSRMSRYIIPTKEWTKSLLGDWKELLSIFHIRGKYQTWDCENFSMLFNSFITVRIWSAGYRDTRAGTGWLKVDAKKSWAGIPGNTHHAVIFIVMKKGLYIVEPQNGKYVAIKDYPNKEYIKEIFLF